MTFEQIVELLNTEIPREYYKGDNLCLHDQIFATQSLSYTGSIDLENVEVVDSFGGEGMGDQYWTVLHFKDDDIYVQLYGCYTSYDGEYFQGIRQVKPIQVMKTEWV